MEVQKMAKNKKHEITTKSGFTWKIDPVIADDMELIDQFMAMARGQQDWHAATMAERMLGADGKKALYEHCTVDGIVSFRKVTAELDEIYGKAAEILKKA